MKDALLAIVRELVDHPDNVSVEESGEPDHVALTLTVHSEDMGKVIGKQGRIIRSIRDLVKLIAAKKNIYVDVILAESQTQE